MSRHFSPGQVRQMRRIIGGPVPMEVWRKWDQRPLRALFLRGVFTFDIKHAIVPTKLGGDTWFSFHGSPPKRLYPRQLTFVERSDQINYTHLRRVN